MDGFGRQWNIFEEVLDYIITQLMMEDWASNKVTGLKEYYREG